MIPYYIHKYTKFTPAFCEEGINLNAQRTSSNLMLTLHFSSTHTPMQYLLCDTFYSPAVDNTYLADKFAHWVWYLGKHRSCTDELDIVTTT